MSTTALAVITGFLVIVSSAAWATVRWGSWRLLGMGVIGVAASTWLAIWLYSKRPTPGPAPCVLATVPGELGSICGFKNPEDLDYVQSQARVLVSEEGFGGRLLSLRLHDLAAGPQVLWPPPPNELARMAARRGDLGDADCPFPSDPAALWPHGLSVLEPREPGGPVRVAFVSHRLMAGRVTDAVQLFDLTQDDVLSWRGCIAYPEDVLGNDLAYLQDGSLVATNFAPNGTLDEVRSSVLRGGLGFDTGDILRWSGAGGWSHLPDTRGAIPNGIAVARDERELYFADAGNEQIAIVPLTAAGGEISRVRVGGAPNNLTVTSSGKVLATGATWSGDLPFLCSIGGRQCRSGWAVWEIDPEQRTAVEVVANDGRRIASATTALEVEGTLYLGSMADDRVGVYRKP